MNAVYSKHPDAEDVEVEGGWIIWHHRLKIVVMLQGMPGLVWRLIRRRKDHQEMVRQIGKDHRLQADCAEAMVASAIREFMQIGILMKVPFQTRSIIPSMSVPPEQTL
ncbi:hypothetical protein ACFQWB_13535 [Paenibacillus thermoaerophilus]|uniref:Coenzyme PQQ synthesis protein D (PqqD) n=1 Tax=Paenibacillus thermoaerophilus TaxID=1215385 RepID=A0ABW2V478_9BACL|nr:hypothetical protein [Paenibacillus thermoaerophilus]TMV16151.1 hypothetical protein FE781_08785 [Paenibacillus thermoaerophilus]